MAIKPTASEVISKGQLLRCYFPRLDSDEAFATHVETEITLVDAQVERRLKSVYETTDAKLQLILKEGETYLALARLWTQIVSMMIGFTGSELPREFIDPEEAARLRDYYADEGEKIMTAYEPEETPEGDGVFAAPYFGAAGVAAEADSVVKRWHEDE